MILTKFDGYEFFPHADSCDLAHHFAARLQLCTEMENFVLLID